MHATMAKPKRVCTFSISLIHIAQRKNVLPITLHNIRIENETKVKLKTKIWNELVSNQYIRYQIE